MYHKIQEGAVFIADSHFNERRGELLELLLKIKEKTIAVPQLFLMGDMFDFISSESRYFVKRNQEVLDLINELSSEMEVVYLEGNHDYNMKALFPKVAVYKREEQPVLAQYKDQSVALSHGDIFVPGNSYDLYCKVIRNHGLLRFLNLIDFNHIISKKIYYSLIKKEICSIIPNFKQIVQKRLQNYEADIVIEGHFHQGSEYKIKDQCYKNIPSLTCSKQFTRLVDSVFIEEKM